MINTRNEPPEPEPPLPALFQPASGGLEKNWDIGLRGDLVLIMNPRRRAPWCNRTPEYASATPIPEARFGTAGKPRLV